MKLHANARTCPNSRRLLVERIDAGWSLAEAAEAAGVSDRTAAKWRARWRAEGEEGLLDRSSAPKRVPHRTPVLRVEAIVALRRLRMTAAEIAELLSMALSTVSAVLQRVGLGKLSRLDPPEPPNRYEHARPGGLLHLDYMTDDARRIYGGRVELAPFPVGAHIFAPERVSAALAWRGGQFPLEILRRMLGCYGPWILADTPGGHDELRAVVDPRLRDMVDDLTPAGLPLAHSFTFPGIYTAAGAASDVRVVMLRIRDEAGRIVGTVVIAKPAVGMAVIARITALGDLRHFNRMERVARPGRRGAAILFADLESSSSLARRLSTAGYFALVRRIARAADASVIDAGGLVGQHAGDGVVGFFLAESTGSESAAARECIAAARALKDAVPDVAARCDLTRDDVILRFGLHWGANLFVGQITTRGRTEVTALGDQVNEAARIEACATGGRMLASKDLIERLEPDDAAALDLRPDHTTYTALADLNTATDKARRDAPAIAVCDVSNLAPDPHHTR